MDNKKGFTLVELLAVIVILAIILVIAVPTIMDTINESRKATFESTVKLIETTAEKRFLENETLGITDEIKCEDIVTLSEEDYEWCEVSIDNGKASVTLEGKGKFENLKEYGTLSGYVQNIFKVEEKRNENSLTNLDPDKNIRYSGSNPNNYVYYNCDDKDDKGVSYGSDEYDYKNSCEIWRVIGVFDVSNGSVTEKRVKLVRNESIGNMSWDSSYGGEGIENSINYGEGVNEWSQADIKEMLNTYYIRKSNVCKYCNGAGQATCENVCTDNVKQLSDTALNMIENVVWKTGAKKWEKEISVDTMYNAEIGTEIGKKCEGTTYENGIYCTDNVERTIEWKGFVGLIYPSDYAYASKNETCLSDILGEESTCKNDNWLHPGSRTYWTISPYYTFVRAYGVLNITYSNCVDGGYAYNSLSVRPSVYLKSSIKVIGGDGVSNSPYKLSL